MRLPAARAHDLAFAFIWASVCFGSAQARGNELCFGRPFGSGMVIQRDRPLAVWGASPANAAVAVSFHGITCSAVADKTGHWTVTFPALKPSGHPAAMVPQSGPEQLVLRDCLVGDVWVCAGQSNMLFPLNQTENGQREVAAAHHPLLRVLPLVPPAGSCTAKPYTSSTFKRLQAGRFLEGNWTACHPNVAGLFPAVPYFFGEQLLLEEQVPIGIICLAVGGTPTEAWIGEEALAQHPTLASLVQGNWLTNPALEGWCRDRAVQNLSPALQSDSPPPSDDLGPEHPFKPGFMWRVGVAPLLPLEICGVAWYQGESNADTADRVSQQASLLPLLVETWRRQWHRPDLPFVFVQLPGLDRPFWPLFRDCQRQSLSEIPGGGMVVTIDLGDRRDVHPRDKRPVGERLAHWAHQAVYRSAEKTTASTGPLATTAALTPGSAVEIAFTETAGRLMTTDGKPPRHFEVASADSVFRPVRATIVGDRVVLDISSDSEGGPHWVRYAWQPFPDPPVNLTNAVGLPASPFLLSVSR